MQLIRLEDDALAEFFNSYVTSALEMYLQAKSGVQAAIAPWNPFAQMANPFGRFFGGFAAPQPTSAPSPAAATDDVAQLRREIEELKRSVKKKKR